MSTPYQPSLSRSRPCWTLSKTFDVSAVVRLLTTPWSRLSSDVADSVQHRRLCGPPWPKPVLLITQHTVRQQIPHQLITNDPFNNFRHSGNDGHRSLIVHPLLSCPPTDSQTDSLFEKGPRKTRLFTFSRHCAKTDPIHPVGLLARLQVSAVAFPSLASLHIITLHTSHITHHHTSHITPHINDWSAASGSSMNRSAPQNDPLC